VIEMILMALVAGVVLGGLAGEARRQQSVRAYVIVVVAYLAAVGGFFVWAGGSLEPWVLPLVIAFLLVFVLWLPKAKKARPAPADED